VNIQFFGGLNLPELYKHVTPEKHWEAIVVNADSLTREVLPAASRAAGERIHQSIVIVDLKGFGFVVGASCCQSNTLTFVQVITVLASEITGTSLIPNLAGLLS
jgi:hypothetical protein